MTVIGLSPALGVPSLCHVDGTWQALGTASFDVRDKSTDAVLATVPDATPADVELIMAGAQKGFERWRAQTPRTRADVLHRAYELVGTHAEALAELISQEMGKALPDSRAEVAYARGFLREYAEQATRIEGRHAQREDGAGRLLTQREPVGPCVLVTPWNFPLAMGTRKIAPALAAGCSVVVKPPRQTPLTMLALIHIFLEAGVEPSAVSVVTTADSAGVTAALIDDPRAAKLSFTGSTEVGRHLAAHGGGRLLRMSMELGGNAPFLVFEDADIDAALAGAAVAKFRNGGQACTAANRFLVHEAVADRFTAGLVAVAEDLELGVATDSATRLGPLIDDRAAATVGELVEDALQRGARLEVGGPGRATGRFFPATVLSAVPADARVMHEEIFGPVAPIMTFRDEDEALTLANATEYGLAAYAFTSDAERMLRISSSLAAGMVGLNTGLVSNPAAPFGGIKASGFGREGGPEGLDEYLQVRYVAIAETRA